MSERRRCSWCGRAGASLEGGTPRWCLDAGYSHAPPGQDCNTVTPDMLAGARMTLEAETSVRGEAFGAGVPADPSRIKDFQREWRQRPRLRALIHVADSAEFDGTPSPSRLLEALQWMAASPEWRREEGGRLDVGFVSALNELEAPHA